MAAVFHKQREVKEGNLWIYGAARPNLAASFFLSFLHVSTLDLTLSTRRNEQKQEGRSRLCALAAVSCGFPKELPQGSVFH